MADPERTDDSAQTWDRRIFAVVDPGIDDTLLDENLRRTPQERLNRMLAMACWFE